MRRWGNSSKCWNTMPTRARRRGRSTPGLRRPSEGRATPSTVMAPCWNGSSALMHLMSVLLPEPLGPQTTTTSPRATWRVQDFRTCMAGPYHLLTPSMLMMAGPMPMPADWSIVGLMTVDMQAS